MLCDEVKTDLDQTGAESRACSAPAGRAGRANSGVAGRWRRVVEFEAGFIRCPLTLFPFATQCRYFQHRMGMKDKTCNRVCRWGRIPQQK